MTVTPEMLGGLAGFVLSALFTYIPNLRTNWANLPKERQQLYMLLMLVGITGVIVGSSCLNLWVFVACTKQGIMSVITVLGTAVVSNVVTYTALPQPKDVQSTRQLRKVTEVASIQPPSVPTTTSTYKDTEAKG